MNPPGDPPRWLDNAPHTDPEATAPRGFDRLVKADASTVMDSARLARVADRIAQEVGHPQLAEALRAPPMASPGNDGSPGRLTPAKVLSIAAVAALLGALTYVVVPSAHDGDQGPPPKRDAAADKRHAQSPSVEAQPVAPVAPIAAGHPDSAVQTSESRASAIPRKRRAPKRSPNGPRPPTDLDPTAELKLLTQAQRALRSNPQRALALTRTHVRRFGSGSFVQEREMIAIEALLSLDRPKKADARGRRFLHAYPRSSHGPRLRELLERADE